MQITEQMHQQALEAREQGKLPIEFWSSNDKECAVFGTVGLTIVKTSGRARRNSCEKHLNYWPDYSYENLCRKIREEEWSVGRYG